jgi:peptidoglycan/LPS O-acetylase OafA/YrhL
MSGKTGAASTYEPATRTASGTPRLPVLDGFRAYAIMGIVAVHLLGASGVLGRANGTDRGVVLWSIFGNTLDAFFIISGFVLFLPTVARGGEFGSKLGFWIGRGARLLPGYWLVLTICLLLIVVAPPFAGYPFPTLESIVAHFTVMHLPLRLFDPGVTAGFGMDGAVWMISIVVTFYIALPFVARAYARHPLIGLAIAAAITIAWKQTIARAPGVFEALSDGAIPNPDLFIKLIAVDQFPGWAFSFGLGMTGAWAYVWATRRFSADRLRRVASLAAVPSLLLYGVAAYMFGSMTLVFDGRISPLARSHTLETMLSSTSRGLLMAVIILGPVWMRRPFVNRPTAKLAELSYGVYLIHIVLVLYAAAVLHLPEDGSLGALAIWCAVIIPPSLLYAAVTRRWVELPIQRWIRTRRAGRRAPPLAVPRTGAGG